MGLIFRPMLTPAEMLERGVFGHSYFEKATAVDLEGLGLPVGLVEVNRGKPNWASNAYGVRSGMNHQQWIAKGWIFPEDPLGWFHWYCRWHAGRIHERDAHQQQRQIRFLAGAARFGGLHDMPVVRQSLLQWAYDPEVVFGR